MNRLTTLLLVITILISCEAPHRNPLDPKNPAYSYARISGVVQTVSLPVEPIAQTVVYWQSDLEQTLTDQQGKFELLLPTDRDGWLLFSHQDFHSDSIFVNWPENKELNVDIHLNALPRLDSLAVYSVVLNRFPSFQKEQLIIEARINDRDNDIDSVQAIFFGDTQGYHLPYNTTEKSFRREFSIFDLGVIGLEELAGQPVRIEVKDIFSNFLIVGQGQLVRVIHDEVIFISPAGDTTTGSGPTLVWQRFEPGFEFHYNVEIYTNEVAPQLVWAQIGLAMDQTTLIVDSELPDGSYFWVIWAVDIFGNRTRSKPAAFNVQGGM
jgi:hypothetical protein